MKKGACRNIGIFIVLYTIYKMYIPFEKIGFLDVDTFSELSTPEKYLLSKVY